MSTKAFTWSTKPADLQKHFANSDPVVKKAIKPSLVRLQKVGATEAAKKAPKSTGALKKSLFVGGSHTASYIKDYEMGVGSKLDYATAQDKGTKPGTWPKFTAMRSWVQRTIKPGPQLDSVTFLVSRKIFEHGLPKHEFMKAGEKAIKNKLPAESKVLLGAVSKGLTT